MASVFFKIGLVKHARLELATTISFLEVRWGKLKQQDRGAPGRERRVRKPTSRRTAAVLCFSLGTVATRNVRWRSGRKQ